MTRALVGTSPLPVTDGELGVGVLSLLVLLLVALLAVLVLRRRRHR